MSREDTKKIYYFLDENDCEEEDEEEMEEADERNFETIKFYIKYSPDPEDEKLRLCVKWGMDPELFYKLLNELEKNEK